MQPHILRGSSNRCLKLTTLCVNVKNGCIYRRKPTCAFKARTGKPNLIFYGTFYNMFKKLKRRDALLYCTVYDLLLLIYTFLYISLHNGDVILFSWFKGSVRSLGIHNPTSNVCVSEPLLSQVSHICFFCTTSTTVFTFHPEVPTVLISCWTIDGPVSDCLAYSNTWSHRGITFTHQRADIMKGESHYFLSSAASRIGAHLCLHRCRLNTGAVNSRFACYIVYDFSEIRLFAYPLPNERQFSCLAIKPDSSCSTILFPA